MNRFEVKVVGSKRLRRGTRPIRRIGAAIRTVMLRPGAIVLTAVVGGVMFIGTPHVGWDYQCMHPMRGAGTCQSVSWCAYYGVQGRRIETPERGQRCKLMTVLPVNWSKVIEGVR